MSFFNLHLTFFPTDEVAMITLKLVVTLPYGSVSLALFLDGDGVFCLGPVRETIKR